MKKYFNLRVCVVYGNMFIVVVIIKILFLDVKEVFMNGVIFKLGCVIVFYFCFCGIRVMVSNNFYLLNLNVFIKSVMIY